MSSDPPRTSVATLTVRAWVDINIDQPLYPVSVPAPTSTNFDASQLIIQLIDGGGFVLAETQQNPPIYITVDQLTSGLLFAPGFTVGATDGLSAVYKYDVIDPVFGQTFGYIFVNITPNSIDNPPPPTFVPLCGCYKFGYTFTNVGGDVIPVSHGPQEDPFVVRDPTSVYFGSTIFEHDILLSYFGWAFGPATFNYGLVYAPQSIIAKQTFHVELNWSRSRTTALIITHYDGRGGPPVKPDLNGQHGPVQRPFVAIGTNNIIFDYSFFGTNGIGGQWDADNPTVGQFDPSYGGSVFLFTAYLLDGNDIWEYDFNGLLSDSIRVAGDTFDVAISLPCVGDAPMPATYVEIKPNPTLVSLPPACG